jgi:tetratricopeptide (TPR) repeat protein
MALDRKTLRKTLRSWNQSKSLGENPLARMRVVDSKRRTSGYGDTQVGYGIALREVLQEAIDVLKPGEGLPDPLQKAWRPYQILTGLYIQGRSAEFLASEMGIARNTFNHEQAAALDRLLSIVGELEESAQSETPSELQTQPVAPPFTAPPRPPHGLVGRDELLTKLEDQLSSAGRLALHGLPGVGKTALAIELGHRTKKQYDGGVLWTSLGPSPDLAVQFHLWEIAMGLHASEVRELPDLKARASQLHSLIGERRLLLIVDDVWDEAAARSFEIGGAHCGYLFTTRSPKIAAALAGEFSVGVQELDEIDGLVLLERFVPRKKQQNKDRWRELVGAVGGLPQALVIAGSALRSAAYADQPRRLREFLDRLADPVERLTLERTRSALDQQAGIPSDEPISLQAVIALSDEALSPSARSALRKLSILPPKPSSFDEHAAKTISGELATELDQLTDSGMMEAVGEQRYTIHRTISDFARTQIDSAAPAELIVDHYVARTEQNAKRFNELNPEIQNILTALRLANESGFSKQYITGVNALYPYLEANGLLGEADQLLEKAIDISSDHSETSLNAGRIALRLGDLERSERYFSETVQAGEDPAVVSAALLGLGATAYAGGDHDGAEEHYSRGLSLAKEQRLHDREAALLTNIGILAVNRGEQVEAESCFLEALGLARAEEDRALLGSILTNLGVIAAQNLQFQPASDYFVEAVEMARADGNRRMMAYLHTNLGALAHDQGYDARAEEEFETALRLSRELGDRQRMSHILANLSALATAKREFETAQGYLTEGLQSAQGGNLKENQVLLLINSAELQRELGNFDDERSLLQEGLDIAEEIGHERYREIVSERLEANAKSG